MLGFVSTRVQVLKRGMFVLDGFEFDKTVPLVVFHKFEKFVSEVTVFEKSGDSVQLRVCKREDSYADLTGCVLDSDTANTSLVTPLVQALQAVEQLLFSVNGAGFRVRAKFQGLPPYVRASIIGRRLQRGRSTARMKRLFA